MSDEVFPLHRCGRRLISRLYPSSPQQQLSTEQRNWLIRQRFEAGSGLSELARLYSISPQRIFQIVHHRNRLVARPWEVTLFIASDAFQETELDRLSNIAICIILNGSGELP